MYSSQNPIRIEAASLDNQAVEQRKTLYGYLKACYDITRCSGCKHTYSSNATIIPGSRNCVNDSIKYKRYTISILFVWAGLTLALIVVTKTKDYTGDI